MEGFGGASLKFVVDPAAAAIVTGFAPAEGLTSILVLLGMSNDNLQIDIGSAEGVMLANVQALMDYGFVRN